MRVLLVYPNAGGLRAFQIGIGVLSSVLKNHGHEVALFDTTFIPEAKQEDAFEEKVQEFQPGLIAFSIRTVDYGLAKRLKGRIAKLRIPTVAGGIHSTLAPEETASVFGMVLRGENERALPELIHRIENDKSIEDAPNLCLQTSEGKYIQNELLPLFENLDELPFPDWDLFDKRHFSESTFLDNAMAGAKCVGIFEKSRGCPYQCSYCCMPTLRKMYQGLGRWYREKSIDSLVEEILSFKAKYPMDFMHFIDDNFFMPSEKMAELRDAFKEKIQVPFSTSERPERITPELMKMFKEAGGYRLWIGVESGDEELRTNRLKRKMSNKTIIQAFQIACQYGIKTKAATMVGLPDQDDASYLKTYDLAGQLQSDMQYSIFYPFVGTEIYDYCIEQGYYVPRDDYVEKSFHERSSLKMPGMSNRKIMRYQRLLYHMQNEYSPFKRWIVKWAGRSEIIFTLIFFFYIGPRIFVRNKGWLRELGFLKTMKRILGYYVK